MYPDAWVYFYERGGCEDTAFSAMMTIEPTEFVADIAVPAEPCMGWNLRGVALRGSAFFATRRTTTEHWASHVSLLPHCSGNV